MEGREEESEMEGREEEIEMRRERMEERERYGG